MFFAAVHESGNGPNSDVRAFAGVGIRPKCAHRASRQELYKEFIEEASKCHVDALQHDKPDISALAGIYARINRMRVQSSPKVVESAERVGRKVVDAYLAPDKSFPELREMLNSGALNLLSEFSDACRADSIHFVPSNSEGPRVPTAVRIV